MDESLKKLISGYKRFRDNYLSELEEDKRSHLASEQSPEVMIISCSDSRVNPAMLTHAGLGEIFTVSNVANLVPPYKEGHDTHHSTSAAIEFAVRGLKVKNIIVMGHSGCGGINALLNGVSSKHPSSYSFIEPWVDIAKPAKEIVLNKIPNGSSQEKQHMCEKEALLVSLKNLDSFPWVAEAKRSGNLKTHAWYYDIKQGEIRCYNDEIQDFEFIFGE